jgi:hypothetical protein
MDISLKKRNMMATITARGITKLVIIFFMNPLYKKRTASATYKGIVRGKNGRYEEKLCFFSRLLQGINKKVLIKRKK